jgi:hypothetical protein
VPGGAGLGQRLWFNHEVDVCQLATAGWFCTSSIHWVELSIICVVLERVHLVDATVYVCVWVPPHTHTQRYAMQHGGALDYLKAAAASMTGL